MKRNEILSLIKEYITTKVDISSLREEVEPGKKFVVAKVTYKPEEYTKYVRFAKGKYTGNSPEQYLKNSIQLRQREKKDFDPNTLSYYFNSDSNPANYDVEFIATDLSPIEATQLAQSKNNELGIKDKRLGALAGVSNFIEVDKKDIIEPKKDGVYYINKMALPKYKNLKVDKKVEIVISGKDKITQKPKTWTYLKVVSKIQPTTSSVK